MYIIFFTLHISLYCNSKVIITCINWHFDCLKTNSIFEVLFTAVISRGHEFMFNLISDSDDIRNKMKSKYLSNPDYNYEKVNRASLACGPMVKWAIAQVIIFFVLQMYLAFCCIIH